MAEIGLTMLSGVAILVAALFGALRFKSADGPRVVMTTGCVVVAAMGLLGLLLLDYGCWRFAIAVFLLLAQWVSQLWFWGVVIALAGLVMGRLMFDRFFDDWAIYKRMCVPPDGWVIDLVWHAFMVLLAVIMVGVGALLIRG